MNRWVKSFPPKNGNAFGPAARACFHNTFAAGVSSWFEVLRVLPPIAMCC
jgi:hypothetical protein